MASLIDYLKHLDARRTPGVSDTVLHFATIVTPDADPVARRGMLDVLEHFFIDRNAFQRSTTSPLVTSGKTSYSKTMFRANRRWELHVWQLGGPAETWPAQLEKYLAEQPVFAVISGLAGSNWAPVQAFCEHAGLPCLFPNVLAPPDDADRGFYSIYYSKGVSLEAELIAARIASGDAGAAAKAVRQIYRAGDVGEAAARQLAALLRQQGVAVTNEPLAAAVPELGKAVRAAHAGDVLVLWLRRDDVAALTHVPAPKGEVYLSGLMGGLEGLPLPAAWRARALIAQPVDLPERRRVRVDYALGWFAIRHVPVVAMQVQADTYLACGLLSETLNNMADAISRDYLVERLEDMIEHRVLTGYYPRLTLGTGQRFASKGGYLVRFTGEEGSRVVADHGWTVP
jgi:hypothetical protein